MAKTNPRFSITRGTLIKRVNRALSRESEEVVRTSRAELDRSRLGDYYVLNVGRNVIVRTHVDLAKMARQLGVIARDEVLVA